MAMTRRTRFLAAGSNAAMGAIYIRTDFPKQQTSNDTDGDGRYGESRSTDIYDKRKESRTK